MVKPKAVGITVTTKVTWGPSYADNGVIDMPVLYYKTQDDVPEDVRDSAIQVKEDGEFKDQWSVNLVSRKKLEEFRDNNKDLSTKLEAANGILKRVSSTIGVSSLEEFDPAKFSEDWSVLNDTARKVADGKLKASDDIDKVVEERIAVMRQKFDSELQSKQVELAAMRSERDKAVSDFRRTFVDRAVTAAMMNEDLGVHRSAADDIRVRAYDVFKVEDDGQIRPEKNGQTLWGEDGSTPMTMVEWIGIVLRKECPHYFEKSSGGGAGGGADSKQFGGHSQEEFNKLPARRRLEIVNEQTFANGGRTR